MSIKTEAAVRDILRELGQHPALSFLTEIVPAVGELSHEWNDTIHFAARESFTGLPVVIKVGVTEAEMYWTQQLCSAAPGLFPKLFAADYLPTQAAGGQVGFIATERIPYTLIGPAWEGNQTDMLLDAAALFHQAARNVTTRHIPPLPISEVKGWLADGCSKNPPGDWRSVQAHAEEDYAWLRKACPFEICHGDLHVGNALSRTPPPEGIALLIDLNPVLQPWVFDAAWVEVVAWGDHCRLGMGYTIRRLAERRTGLGLDVSPADAQERAGRIALSWLAIRIWDPDHLEFMPGFMEATEDHINSGAAVPRQADLWLPSV